MFDATLKYLDRYGVGRFRHASAETAQEAATKVQRNVPKTATVVEINVISRAEKDRLRDLEV